MKNIDILYEDADCVVLNKPAGLAVQGGTNITISLDDLLASEWNQRPFLVHRLDRDTSGLLLVAKTKGAAAYYSGIIAGKGAEKRYMAVCLGLIQSDTGKIDEPIWIRGTERASLTFYHRIANSETTSLVELQLGSGRMHQIRRHLALIGHPIIGDDKYGDFSLNKTLKRDRGIKKMLLHAYQLQFPQRTTKKIIKVKAPLPDYMYAFLDKEYPIQEIENLLDLIY